MGMRVGVVGLGRIGAATAVKARALGFTVVGSTPADYLAGWRISLAQGLLRQGRPLKAAADELGYGSAASLSRAFSQAVGCSPRAWLARQQASKGLLTLPGP